MPARTPKPKYSVDPFGMPFGPGHPLWDPKKDESSTPTPTPEQIQQMIADALAGQQGAGQQQGVASLAERIGQHLVSGSNPEYIEEFDTNKDGKISTQDAIFAQQFAAGLRDPETLQAININQPQQSLAERIGQHLVSGSNPEYIEEFDTNKDGKISTQDAIFAKQFDAGLRDPETLEAIQTQEQPDLSGFTTQEDLDAAIQSALAGQTGPDLSGYAQQGDMDSAIEAALAGQDFSGFASQADIDEALAGLQGGPDRTSIEQMISDAIGGIQGPDLSGYAQQGDMDSAIEAALAGQDFGGFTTDAELQSALAGIQGPDLSGFMTAADAKELFQGMDTSGIEAGVLQKMGLPDMLTEEAVQDAINQALGGAGGLSEADVERILQEQMGNQNIDLSDYLKTGKAEEMFVGEAKVQQMITDGLAQGLSPEQIQAMIAEATGGQVSEEMIQEMIAEAMAQAGTGGLTEEAVQAMIDATGQGASMEQIQKMLGETGYLTQEQIQGMIQESATPGFDSTGLEERLAALEAAGAVGGDVGGDVGPGPDSTTGPEDGDAATPYVPPDPNQYKVATGPYGYNPYQSGQYQSDPYGPSGVPKMGGVTTIPTPDNGYTIFNPYNNPYKKSQYKS